MDNNVKNEQTRPGITRWLVREYMGVVVVALSLLMSAGRWDWGWGWALVVIYFLWTSANTILLWQRDPDLLVERATRHKDAKGWDTAIMSVVGILTLVKHIVAGLDLRYAWSVAPAPTLRVMLWLLAAGGYALGTWAMVSNAYFTTINRIQAERGHSVADNGPYRYVRHPGYSGVILFELATPLVLGSWWALILGVANAVLIILRTALEDQSLRVELPGYAEYAERTRYRLLPGVW